MSAPDRVSLTPGKRVLFLTKDPELVRRQLRGELDLLMKDLRPEDLLDDVNTDAMTPAWACFDYRPEDIARNAYAGITVGSERLFPEGALMAGNFEVIASGLRKGVGSSRETAVQAEKWSGIRIAIAASFAPIHARNNIAQGVLMGDHAMLVRLQAGEQVPLAEFAAGYDAITRLVGVDQSLGAMEKREERIPDRRGRDTRRIDRVVEIAPNHEPRDGTADRDDAPERLEEGDEPVLHGKPPCFPLQCNLLQQELVVCFHPRTSGTLLAWSFIRRNGARTRTRCGSG